MSAVAVIGKSQSKPKPDPLRIQLQKALEAADKAGADLHRHRNAIDKTRASVRSAEKAVEVARKGNAKVLEEHGQELAAAALADDDILPPTNKARLACAGLQDAEDELLALRAAHTSLLADPRWDLEAAKADIRTEEAISTILSSIAARLLDRLHDLIEQAVPIRASVAALLEAHTGRAVSPDGLRPIEGELDRARKLVTAVSVGDASTKAPELVWNADLSGYVLPNAGADPWTAARARLRADPRADLSDLVSPAPQPPG